MTAAQSENHQDYRGTPGGRHGAMDPAVCALGAVSRTVLLLHQRETVG
jgi:hypothetical protein